MFSLLFAIIILRHLHGLWIPYELVVTYHNSCTTTKGAAMYINYHFFSL